MKGQVAVRWGWLLLVFTLPLFAGCGRNDKTEVYGTVTVDGQPLEEGSITFIALGQNGRSAGGLIRDGQYRVLDVYPGKNRIMIDSTREQQFSMGEMMSAAKEIQARNPELKGGKFERAVFKKGGADFMLPSQTAGNNQEHDIGGDRMELDIHLERPKD